MNAATLREHLARLDALLGEPAKLCIYGSAALMLLGQEDRFSADVDVAGPYSTVNERALVAAAQQIGLPANPPEIFHPTTSSEWGRGGCVWPRLPQRARSCFGKGAGQLFSRFPRRTWWPAG